MLIEANSPKLYAGNELIPLKSGAEYEALAREQADAERLAQVDYVLGADEDLGCRLWDKHLQRAIKDAERETAKQGGFAEPDYAALVDVTAVPDCEEKVYLTDLVIRCGAFENKASVYLVCEKKEVVGGRNLWTFVGRVNS